MQTFSEGRAQVRWEGVEVGEDRHRLCSYKKIKKPQHSEGEGYHKNRKSKTNNRLMVQ